MRHPETRSLPRWKELGPVVRFQIGLESPEDLLADLSQALEGLAV